MKVTFYLARPNEKGSTAVISAIRYKNERVNYGVGVSIHPKNWNKDIQKAREVKSYPLHVDFNRKLTTFRNDVERLFIGYQNENGQKLPDPKTLKNILDKNFKYHSTEKSKVTFFNFFEKFIEQSESGMRMNVANSKPININTVKTYKTALRHLKEFQSIYKRKIDFESIDYDFYENYLEYLMLDLELKTNTIGKSISSLKLVLSEAKQKGYNNNTQYLNKWFKVPREEVNSIYLNEKEIEAIYKYDFSDCARLEHTRDLFVLGCETGLRYSDYTNIKKDKIDVKNKIAQIDERKNRKKLAVPFSNRAIEILEKYNYELPKAYSNQNTNDYIKEICEKIDCLKKVETITYTKAGKEQTEPFEKWEKVVTHTARRSFATNEVKKGTPIPLIMAITGHKSEKSFWKYVKLTSTEYAVQLSKQWQENESK